MALIDLLSHSFDWGGTPLTPNYNIAYGGPSKSIKYGDRSGENPAPKYHLVDRVQWYGDNSGGDGSPNYNSNPTFLGKSFGNIIGPTGTDHKSNIPDYAFRGGENVFIDRRKLDFQRIQGFLDESSAVGTQFLIKQGVLQLLNPRKETRTFNAGVSLLAQIAASGFSSIKRHGLIPEPAGININASLGSLLGKVGGKVGSWLENSVGGDYLSTTPINRSSTYGEGDPGAEKQSTNFFGKLLDTVIDNPFKKKSDGRFLKKLKSDQHPKAYIARLEEDWGGIDKINFTTVRSMAQSEGISLTEVIVGGVVDYIPFEFDIMDLEDEDALTTNNIKFRAFLDDFSDSYNASHNEVKYNGRGESFYTYNKFQRKIAIGFKVAAQLVHEMKPIYQKLNYLAAQTAPAYSAKSGRIMTPYMRVTMGDYLNSVPGVLTNVNIS